MNYYTCGKRLLNVWNFLVLNLGIELLRLWELLHLWDGIITLRLIITNFQIITLVGVTSQYCNRYWLISISKLYFEKNVLQPHCQLLSLIWPTTITHSSRSTEQAVNRQRERGIARYDLYLLSPPLFIVTSVISFYRFCWGEFYKFYDQDESGSISPDRQL